jgi:hypothetical protein
MVIRRGRCDRIAQCLSVESIGGGGRSTDFTHPIDAWAAACQARNFMPQRAQRAD